ncbi:hypothetical protein K438DRAFT_662728 [Mycena galopus ATCC 62051]|nr:hypothetical protein K438DRAFT_662728 [Mycena galopus ATCC 62051]
MSLVAKKEKAESKMYKVMLVVEEKVSPSTMISRQNTSTCSIIPIHVWWKHVKSSPSVLLHQASFMVDGSFWRKCINALHIYVLHGLGGAGKTQIALKFLQDTANHQSSFTDRFFVDASTTNTIETGLRNIATAKEIGNSSQDVVKWLATKDEEWVLFFDGADDPQIDLNKFFPKCNHGNIIITSRHCFIWDGTHSRVSDMTE